MYGVFEAAERRGWRQVYDRRTRIPKSRQGRPKIAHGFNRGLRVENRQSPGGAKEKIGLDRRVLSSLTGLVLYSRHNPAMNRWAIFERPCGTWIHDTVNGSLSERGVDQGAGRLRLHTYQLVDIRKNEIHKVSQILLGQPFPQPFRHER